MFFFPVQATVAPLEFVKYLYDAIAVTSSIYAMCLIHIARAYIIITTTLTTLVNTTIPVTYFEFRDGFVGSAAFTHYNAIYSVSKFLRPYTFPISNNV